MLCNATESFDVVLGAVDEPLGTSSYRFGVAWVCLELPWGCLDVPFGSLDFFWNPLKVLAYPWVVPGELWMCLRASSAVLGHPWERRWTSLQSLRGALHVLGNRLGRVWVSLRVHWSSVGSLGTLWQVLKIIEKPHVFLVFHPMEASLGNTRACQVCPLQSLSVPWESLDAPQGFSSAPWRCLVVSGHSTGFLWGPLGRLRTSKTNLDHRVVSLCLEIQ